MLFSSPPADATWSTEYQHDDDQEQTTTCSTFFSRKRDPLVALGSPEQNGRVMATLLRQCISLNEDGDSATGCDSSNAIMPRSLSWPRLDGLQYTQDELDMVDGDERTPESDFRPTFEECRNFWVVTTATLPWMTGTAVNPLLRAAYLSRMNRPYTDKSTVTLVVPWLESSDDRVVLYGTDWKDATCSVQEAYIRSWLADKANLPLEADLNQGGIRILFYPARFFPIWKSIFATGDICAMIPDDGSADVCFLEEPERLVVYRAPFGNSWRDKFNFVVGVVHTNYSFYASQYYLGIVAAPAIEIGCSLFLRATCHKVIKLSPVLQSYAPKKEVISNVHGVRNEFLEEGRRRALFGGKNGVYFVGKLLWIKGLDKMLGLQAMCQKITGDYFPIDIFGSGSDERDIQRAFRGRFRRSESDENSSDDTHVLTDPKAKDILKDALPIWRRQSIPARFLGRQDHATLTEDYKVFVNPSISEVLCTTTAEAIAMGKFALVPAHPSNTFFVQFPNCLQYRNKEEFVVFLQHALSHEPEPLTEELAYQLTWEAGTERCISASAITRRAARRRDRTGQAKKDERIATELPFRVCASICENFLREDGPEPEQVKCNLVLQTDVTEKYATAVN